MFSGKHMTPMWDNAGRLEGFRVPTLSAYAIEHAELTPPPDIDAGFIQLSNGSEFWIASDLVCLHHPFQSPFLTLDGALDRTRLVVHYHGIRDFTLLFPQVEDDAVRRRLGEFYAEAEAVFDSGAWLSFALMAGAIYEGLLGVRLKQPKETFARLIQLAQEEEAIDAHDAAILTDARKARNLVHASKADKGQIARKDAMDMRRIVDRLIREFSLDSSAS
jgi:hypothetical protein